MDIKTLHGHIFTCTNCKKIHFEFNQFGMDFSTFDVVKDFNNYLKGINSFKEEQKFRDNAYKRKIQIPFPRTSIKMLLSAIDLEELKMLVQTFIVDYEQELEDKKFMRQLASVSKTSLN